MFYERVFRELARRKIRYLVIGGIAVNIHGYSRATGDLDIMLSLKKDNLERFIELVNTLGFIPRIPVKIEELKDPEKVESWKKEKHLKVFSIYNPQNALEHIDIMVENYIDFGSAYNNREVVTAKGIEISVISIDDLIELKKIAGRKRDEMDIEALKKIKEIKNGQQ
jgi:predicted nucleotidyltransferase